jgi:hypothetical protein
MFYRGLRSGVFDGSGRVELPFFIRGESWKSTRVDAVFPRFVTAVTEGKISTKKGLLLPETSLN